jgi:hypothetical protein
LLYLQKCTVLRLERRHTPKSIVSSAAPSYRLFCPSTLHETRCACQNISPRKFVFQMLIHLSIDMFRSSPDNCDEQLYQQSECKTLDMPLNCHFHCVMAPDHCHRHRVQPPRCTCSATLANQIVALLRRLSRPSVQMRRSVWRLQCDAM